MSKTPTVKENQKRTTSVKVHIVIYFFNFLKTLVRHYTIRADISLLHRNI